MKESIAVRVVQEIGKGSLMITLPKNWAKKYGINKGSLLSIKEREDGSLIIKPQVEQKESSSVILDLDKCGEITSGIIGAYLLGFDTITLRRSRNLSVEDKEQARNILEKLLGLEIIEEKENEITLKCFIDESFLNVLLLFKRMNSLVIEMIELSLRLLSKYEERLAKIVAKRDDELDRLYFLMIRILRSAVSNPSLSDSLGLKPVECLDYRVAAEILEKMGDLACQLANKIKSLNIKLEEETVESVVNVLKEVHLENFLAFMSRRLDRMLSARALKGKATSTFASIEKKFPSVREITGDLSKMIELSEDLLDLVLPLELELHETV